MSEIQPVQPQPSNGGGIQRKRRSPKPAIAPTTEHQQQQQASASNAVGTATSRVGSESAAIVQEFLANVDELTSRDATVMVQALEDMPYATLQKFAEAAGGMSDRSDTFRQLVRGSFQSAFATGEPD